jgi:hypothetical protein
MSAAEKSWDDVRINGKRVEELEYSITNALSPLLGDHVKVQINKIIRCEDEVTGLEVAVGIAVDEEETAFAIG